LSSYLKFDGLQDGATAAVFAGVPSDNIVLRLLVRFIELPTTKAPVVVLNNASGQTVLGLWVLAAPAAATDRGKRLAVCWRGDNGGAQEYRLAEIDTGSGPIRAGVVYNIEVVASYADDGVSVGVDGVRVATAGFGAASGWVATDALYAYLGGTVGTYNGSSTILRACHMDLIQVSIDLDATLTTSGGFPDVHADIDPFDDLLTIENNLPGGAVWNLNDGSGTTAADSSGNGVDLDLTGLSSSPAWAPAADPAVTPGSASWTFGSIEGYGCRAGSTVVPMPAYPYAGETAGELRLAPMARNWTEDGEALDQWGLTTNLTAATAGQVWSSRRALHADGSTSQTNSADLPVAGGVGDEVWWVRFRFYDPGGTSSTRLQRCLLATGTNTLMYGAGFMGSVSTSFYVTTVQGASTTNVASSVPVSAGWHEVLVYAEQSNTGGNTTVRIYIDGSLERTETGSFSRPTRAAIRQNGQSASSNDAWYDQIEVGYQRVTTVDAEFAGLVEPTGSVALPVLQPASGVRYYRGVTIDMEDAGATSLEVGDLALTFRHSPDDGATWSSPAALTDANLRAVACAGNGKDRLEITPEFDAGMDGMGSAALRGVTVLFEPATRVRLADEEARVHRMEAA